MRCQPVSNFRRMRVLRRGLRVLPALSAVALAACLPDDGQQSESVQDAADALPIRDRIDRTLKGDRLLVATRPARPSLDEARAAAGRLVHNRTPLTNFYRALSNLQAGLRSEPVTVLHLGDSHIAADGFSGDLRDLLQARFGNAGRGMMMPGFPFRYYRARGVSFSKDGVWKSFNSFKGDPGPYGLSGVRLTARQKGVELALESKDGAFEWAEVTFLAQPGGGEAEVTFGGEHRTVSTEADADASLRVRIARKGRELKVISNGEGTVSVLSWSVGHNRPGLRYVNFGIPGATADTPRRWDEVLVDEGLTRLKPDLIVLGYGTNEGFNDALDAGAYETRVAQFVTRLKNRAPLASVLIMGPPDSLRFPRYARSSKSAAAEAPCRPLSEAEREGYDSLKRSRSPQLARWHEPPSLASVRASLRRVAEANDAHFWDWSQVMGGECGIHAWANADPPLAASDRVHLGAGGAKRSAKALFSELMAGYEAHVRLASR